MPTRTGVRILRLTLAVQFGAPGAASEVEGDGAVDGLNFPMMRRPWNQPPGPRVFPARARCPAPRRSAGTAGYSIDNQSRSRWRFREGSGSSS